MYDLKAAAQALREADAILIGASNGLSISEGLHLFADNAAFRSLFGDFQSNYGLTCLLQGMAGRWPSQEEQWAFWGRLLHHYCGQYRPTKVMEDLKALVGSRDCFVLTSNGEGHFALSGFSPETIWELEGSWLVMQCARPCHNTLYPTLDLAEELAAAEQGGRVPAGLVPRCPRCGGPMAVQIAAGPARIPNREAERRYKAFLQRNHGKRLVILELGVGLHNQLIKAPLMELAAWEPHARYITVNLGEIYIPEAIRAKSCGLDGPMDRVLADLRAADASCEQTRPHSSVQPG